MKSYRDQLKDKRWIVRRCKRIILADGNCERCGSTEKLNVHHTFYISGRMAWEYSDHELEVLCRKCHKAEHGIISTKRNVSKCVISPQQRCQHEVLWLSANHLTTEYKSMYKQEHRYLGKVLVQFFRYVLQSEVDSRLGALSDGQICVIAMASILVKQEREGRMQERDLTLWNNLRVKMFPDKTEMIQ